MQMRSSHAAAQLTDDEVAQLVDRIHRLSARWRPFMIAGLVLVVTGFVVLAGILEHKREQAEATVAKQAAQIADLNATLSNSAVIIQRALASKPDDPDWLALQRLTGTADKVVGTLNSTLDQTAVPAAPADTGQGGSASVSAPQVADAAPVAAAAPVVASVAPQQAAPKIIRIFLHIQDPAQRPAAEAVAAAWSGRQLDGSTVVIPGIELVRGGADDSLRCTKAAACREAGKVLAWANGTLASPALHTVDLSRRFEGSRAIRPGTYEVWFAPGPIALKSAD